MKTCTKCKIEKEDSEFSFQSGIRRDGTYSRKPRRCSWCKECSRVEASKNAKQRRKENPEKERIKNREWYYKNRVKISIQSKKRSRNFKQKCVDYLGGKCEVCGYNKCLGALDFHHEDPEEKKFMITQVPKNFKDVKKELDKCNLLCSNCHKEIHYNQEF